MRNIPTIFIWDKETRTIINKPLRMVDWVFDGKGEATRKYDGVAILVEKGKVFRRHEWKPGTLPPNGFVRLQDPDPKRPYASLPGWVPVPESFKTQPQGVDERALKEAWRAMQVELLKIRFNNKKEAKTVNPYAPKVEETMPDVPDGTYELCGPKIHGNQEGLKSHVLIMHGASLDTPLEHTIVKNVPRGFENLKKRLEAYEGEGFVWHYKIGGSVLMAKIRRRDFGFNTRVSKQDLEMAYRKTEVVVQPAEFVKEVIETKAVATGSIEEDSMLAQL